MPSRCHATLHAAAACEVGLPGGRVKVYSGIKYTRNSMTCIGLSPLPATVAKDGILLKISKDYDNPCGDCFLGRGTTSKTCTKLFRDVLDL